jgi:hypothetical protein
VPRDSLSTQSWVSIAMMSPLNYDLRANPMPRVMHSFKMAHESNMYSRPLLYAVALAFVVSVPVSYWAFIKGGYDHGGLVINPYRFLAMAKEPGTYLERITPPQGLAKTDLLGMAIIAYGALKTLFLVAMRARFLWWPLHPVGYAMSYISDMYSEWMSVFLGWLAGLILQRYGGHRAHARARPLFLGLILGAMVAAGFWLVLDGFTGMRDHKILY